MKQKKKIKWVQEFSCPNKKTYLKKHPNGFWFIFNRNGKPVYKNLNKIEALTLFFN